MNKKVVLHIIIGLNLGGAETTLVKLCLNTKNYHHIVISLTGVGYYTKILEEHYIDVYNLSFHKPLNIFTNCYKLLRLLINLKPNIVQTWMYHADLIGGIFAKICRIDNIFWNIRNSNTDFKSNKFSTFIVVKLCSYLSNTIPDKIISCSHAGMIEHVNFGYSHNKFVIINNGFSKIELNDVRDNLLVKGKSNNNESLFTIGMAARFDNLKDFNTLLRALVEFKKINVNFLCILTGKDIVASNVVLYEKVIKYDLVQNLKLLGQYDNMYNFYSSLDIFILSSLSEGFPNVIAEAMNWGVPCISSNVGDSHLIIGEFGWVVPAKNHLKMAESLIFAYSMFETQKDDWSRLKINCNKRISQNFNLETMFSKYSLLWN